MCVASPPSNAISINTRTTVHTDLGSSDCVALSPVNDAVCVMAGTSVTITSFLIGVGPRPLVVVSASTFDLTGTIDVGSHEAMNVVGAGGDATGCAGTQATASPGGGFGGSFTTKGGDGGTNAPPMVSRKPHSRRRRCAAAAPVATARLQTQARTLVTAAAPSS